MLNNSNDKKFIATIKYLKELNQTSKKSEDFLTPEEQLITIIKNAIVSSPDNAGSIFFKTTKEGKLVVSSVQPHSYNWPLKNKIIDLDTVLSTCEKLGISWQLKPREIYAFERNNEETTILDEFGNPVVKVDTELLFGIDIKNYKSTIKIRKKAKNKE